MTDSIPFVDPSKRVSYQDARRYQSRSDKIHPPPAKLQRAFHNTLAYLPAVYAAAPIDKKIPVQAIIPRRALFCMKPSMAAASFNLGNGTSLGTGTPKMAQSGSHPSRTS